MNKLSRETLYSLEEYAERRADFRAAVMAHKKCRQVSLGEHLRLLFEDVQTIQYQIQEMLRIERIFEAAGIEEELEAYNPLIPDGQNLKATMMLEYTDANERKAELAQLLGIEKAIYLQVDGFDKVYPIANEDLERETEEKTSSVHFLRFELSPAMIHAWKMGTAVSLGVEHAHYSAHTQLTEAQHQALLSDFDVSIVTH